LYCTVVAETIIGLYKALTPKTRIIRRQEASDRRCKEKMKARRK